MSILVGPDTRLVVQGITGREGEFHSRAMLEYGTRIVAGVTPGKGGQSALDGRVPVYDTVAEAVRQHAANASCIYVPAAGAPDAIMEAAGAGIATIFCITEGIPALEMVRVVAVVREAGARLIGPNCPGATSPGEAKVGIIPGSIHRRGSVGVVSRSGTLTYEAVQAMTDAGIGQSTCVGIGGDPIIGTSFTEILGLFKEDPATEAIVLIGEIGGAAEEEAAAYAGEHLLKQVEELGGQIREFEQRIQATFKPTPAIQQLMTVPGVGLTLAVVIALEVGDVARFATAEKLAGYAGTTPRVHASGGKTRFGRSRPDVNRYLKWAFVEAANAICVTRRRSSSRHVSRLYDRIARRKGHPKAIGALARHLAEATFWILSKHEPYREPKISTVSSTGDKREIPLSSRKLDR